MTKEQLEIEVKSLKEKIGWDRGTPMYAACCRDIDRFYGVGTAESEGDCPKVVFDRLKNELINIIHPT